MSQKQKWKAEEKVEIVKRYLKGEIGIIGASRKMDVNKETIRQWIAKQKHFYPIEESETTVRS